MKYNFIFGEKFKSIEFYVRCYFTYTEKNKKVIYYRRNFRSENYAIAIKKAHNYIQKQKQQLASEGKSDIVIKFIKIRKITQKNRERLAKQLRITVTPLIPNESVRLQEGGLIENIENILTRNRSKNS